MCGVAGAMAFAPIEGDVVRPMLAALRHRGPDGESSIYVGEDGELNGDGHRRWRAALGHVRLALVGSSDSGHQPAANPAKTIFSAVNGEIYNHLRIRADLGRRGLAVAGDSDCEVVPHVFEHDGLRGLGHMSGVYSGAIVDLRDMSLTLFRDRFGARPLYYVQKGNALFFASEVKALLAVPGVTAGVDSEAVLEFLAFQAPLGPRTLFAGIRSVEPAQVLRFERGELRSSYLPEMPTRDVPPTFRDAVFELRENLDDAIEQQWHPRASAYLSTGVDTNAIVSTLARRGKLVELHTAEFGPGDIDEADQGCDESAGASDLARGYGMVHRSVPIRAEDFQASFARMIWHLEDLRMPMSFGAWRISQLLSSGKAVLLSGMGSDEIFGGYFDRLRSLPGDDAADSEWLQAYCGAWSQRMTSAEERARALSPALIKAAGDVDVAKEFRKLLAALAEKRGRSSLRRMLTVEQSFFLPGLLVVDDRMSMAHGVETRVPLLDPRIADLAGCVPDEYLVRDGRGKALLRAAIADRAPRHLVALPKQPFRVPETTWYRNDLQSWVRSSLLGPQTVCREFLNEEFITDVLDDHMAGRRNRRHLIWSLLCFEYWCRIFLTGYLGGSAS